jgi:4-nitrophenyl phosphatase
VTARAAASDARLGAIRALLIDMDGVLVRGDQLLAGATDLLSWLERRGIGFRLLTNNSTLTPELNSQRLAGLGLTVPAERIFTSSQATAMYLNNHGVAGQSAYVIGEIGLRSALADIGLETPEAPDATDWVVTGLDRHVTYENLKTAALCLQRGARWVATNSDSSLPVEAGLVPGAGALQAAITATTGQKPGVIGKPEPHMLAMAAESLKVPPDRTAMLGDRLDTDIAAAAAAGMTSILVLTGVSNRADLSESAVQPTIVVEDLPSMMGAWPK